MRLNQKYGEREINNFTKRVMKNVMSWTLDPFRTFIPIIPQGQKGIEKVGHRRYVGAVALWDEIGRLQFDFLLSNGLQPYHYLLDIACGCLRSGIHFIPYLETGHYMGIEKEAALISAGIDQELGKKLYENKKPQLVVSDAFEFEKFSERPDYVLTHSLFTHLPARMINDCFKQLRRVVQPEGVFYATFFEVDRPRINPKQPHSHKRFDYTRQEMEYFGISNGWVAEYIGDWNHPRKQVMVRYRPA